MKPERKRRLVMIAVGIGASALVLGAAVQRPFRVKTEREFKPGTLPYLAKELKAKGITKHDLGIPFHIDYAYPVTGFDQFIDASDAVVVATLMDQRYRMSADLERIETIAKFRVDELLSGTIKRSRGPLPSTRMPGGVAPLAPLKDDEILVFHGGGTLAVDGVLFRQGEDGYPPFKAGRQYVLFLHEWKHQPVPGNYYGGSGVRLYSASLGPDGVYPIEEATGQPAKLKTLNRGSYFKEELEQRFLSRKIHFTEHVRRMGRKPHVEWLEEQ